MRKPRKMGCGLLINLLPLTIIMLSILQNGQTFDLLGFTNSDINQIFGDANCIQATMDTLEEALQKPSSTLLEQDPPQKLTREVPQNQLNDQLSVTFKEHHINSGIITCNGSSDSCPLQKNSISLINELAQYNAIDYEFKLVGELTSCLDKRFVVKLKLGAEEYESEGPSLKNAQAAVASEALFFTKFKHPPIKISENPQILTPTVELNNLAVKRGEDVSYIPNLENGNGKFEDDNFWVNLQVGAIELIGKGLSLQEARHNAASKALQKIRDLPIISGAVQKKSPISVVYEWAAKQKTNVYFEVVSESGPAHMKAFITRCQIGDIITEGEGKSKKISKRNAAEQMVQHLHSSPKSKSQRKRKSLVRNVVKNYMDYTMPQSNQKAIDPSSYSLGSTFQSLANTFIGRRKRRRRNRYTSYLPGLLSIADKLNDTISVAKLKMNDAVEVVKDYLKVGGETNVKPIQNVDKATSKTKIEDSKLPKFSPKEKLIIMSKLFNFEVKFRRISKNVDELFSTLVILNTDPSQICRGIGSSIQEANENAALWALDAIAEMGLVDKIHLAKKKSDYTNTGGVLTPDVGHKII